jgi:hypothetical protein
MSKRGGQPPTNGQSNFDPPQPFVDIGCAKLSEHRIDSLPMSLSRLGNLHRLPQGHRPRPAQYASVDPGWKVPAELEGERKPSANAIDDLKRAIADAHGGMLSDQ